MPNPSWVRRDDAFFFHIQTKEILKNRARAITICVLPTEGGLVPGYAICGKKDNFHRKKGRNISLGRAQFAAEEAVEFMEADSYEALAKKVAEYAELQLHKHSPQWETRDIRIYLPANILTPTEVGCAVSDTLVDLVLSKNCGRDKAFVRIVNL